MQNNYLAFYSDIACFLIQFGLPN